MTFEFIADRPSLDFVATLAERGTTNVEKLTSAEHLRQWIAESGIVHPPPTVTEREFRRALAVREAVFGLLQSLIDGHPPRSTDRELVNQAASHPRPGVRLSAGGTITRSGDVDMVLARLAEDCLGLYDSPDRHLVRWCAGPRCTRPFIDRSRAQQRRWCDMKSCGDRVKAAAYRRRHQADPPRP